MQQIKIINLGAADGLPPVDWTAVVDKLNPGYLGFPTEAPARCS